MSGPRLSITPAGAIFDRRLEPRDQQVLNLLGCYTDKAGWCRRSQVKMAKQLFCGRSSIQRSLENLVAAGWVEKKRPPWSSEEGQPSNSYMYRVVLDRDDFVIPDQDENDTDDGESHAENASEDADCPPMGTPEKPTDGHPGAQPSVGTGAHPYVGTKNVPLEGPLLERERDARARDRRARFLADFETRWPTAAVDDRQRTAYAADGLAEDEQAAALAGIGPFLENLKRLHRKNVPAGWRYLEEKRWTLLEQAKTAAPTTLVYGPDSDEAKAIKALHLIAGRTSAFYQIWRRADGSVNFPKAMTQQLLALAQVPDPAEWIELAANQAAAWESLLDKFFDAGITRNHPRAGTKAPWPWPPSIEGKIYPTGTGPPETLMSEQDMADFKA